MGSIAGHIYPGAAFLVMGMRWFYCLFLRYFLCRREASLGRKGPKRFRSSLVYPWSVLPGLPMDGIAIAGLTGIGMIFEFLWAAQGYFPWHMNLTHITMYFYVFLFGVIVILKHYKLMLVDHIEYGAFALAQFVQGFTLYGHVQGTSPMEQQVHIYQMYLHYAGGILALVEAYYRSDLFLSASRCGILAITGSWNMTLGFILYPQFGEEPWDQESVMQMKMVMLVLLWSVAGMILQLMSVAVTALIRVRCMSAPEVYSALKTPSRNTDREHYRYMLAFSDDDEEV